MIAFDMDADGNLDGYIRAQLSGIGQGSKKYDVVIFEFTGAANMPNATENSLADPKNFEFTYTANPSAGNASYDFSSVASIGDSRTDVDGQGDDAFRVVAIASNNLRQINNDFNGIENQYASGEVAWDDPSEPITSEPFTPDSPIPVPESSAYALLVSLFLSELDRAVSSPCSAIKAAAEERLAIVKCEYLAGGEGALRLIENDLCAVGPGGFVMDLLRVVSIAGFREERAGCIDDLIDEAQSVE